jgi:hypothetical protein
MIATVRLRLSFTLFPTPNQPDQNLVWISAIRVPLNGRG